MSIIIILRDFAVWSTICGVPHIANAKSFFAMIYWTIIFITMVIIFLIQLKGMVVEYFQYPASILTTTVYGEQTFPAITICNFNPYKVPTDVVNEFAEEFISLMNMYSQVVAEVPLESDPYGIQKANTTYERDSRTYDALMLIAAKYPSSTLSPYLYTYDDMIADCTFAGTACKREDFTDFLHPVYGNCLVFNGNTNNTLYTTNRGGKQYGLKLLLTVNELSYDYNETLFLPSTQLSGARLAIHQQGTLPPLDTTAINVGVGQMTTVAFSQTETKRLKKPYGICVTRESAATDFYKSYNYTLDNCYSGCRQRAAMNRCGCINPRYMSEVDNSSVSLCTLTTDVVNCLQGLRGDQRAPNGSDAHNIDTLTDCGCSPPCLEYGFEPTISVAQYPTKQYSILTDGGRAGTCDENPNFDSDEDCSEWYAKNALVVQVFFESIGFDINTETPTYGISSFLNDLGGQAGLWLGISIISCIECCGMFMLVVLFCISGGTMRVQPEEEDLRNDARIQDLNDLQYEIDQHDRHLKKLEAEHGGSASPSDSEGEIEQLKQEEKKAAKLQAKADKAAAKAAKEAAKRKASLNDSDYDS